MLNPQNSFHEIRKILDSQIEWLLICSDGTSFAFQNTEIELELSGDKIILGFLDKTGFQFWRIIDWKYEKEKLSLSLSRNFNREKTKIEFVSRTSSTELAENLELARLDKAFKLGNLIIENQVGAKLIQVELNKENGRFAQIVFENRGGNQTAVLADVSETLSPEILLTSSILWLTKLQKRKKNSIEILWIAAERKLARKLQKIHAFLRESWKQNIKIRETIESVTKENLSELNELKTLDLPTVFKKKSRKSTSVNSELLSQTAQKIIEISSAEIDARQTRNGETLLFNGIAFARIRRILNEEKIWFGIESNRRFLSGNNFGEFVKLIEELKIYRRCDSPNKQHFYYKHAPEAWLESMLRKNIKRLDANLILAPLHNQFRAEREKIDLLALRRDGQLVIIEVKVFPDREIIFQSVDYWRKIEIERRSGNLQELRIFGDLKIKDEPALIYLVAPLFSYHNDFSFLAQAVSPEIEIYRFDVNENWRENLKIIRQEKISKY